MWRNQGRNEATCPALSSASASIECVVRRCDHKVSSLVPLTEAPVELFTSTRKSDCFRLARHRPDSATEGPATSANLAMRA
eukprot:1692340-Pleurochrysis_carterae.AAC.4